MKFRILAAFLALLPLCGTAQADIKFGVAAEPYPPFTAKNASGQWEGFEIDLTNAICAELAEACVIEEVAWDGIIPALQAKKFDAIAASMVITPKRQDVISFSNMYYGGAFALIGAKNGDMDVSPAHLSGKSIGAQASSVNADYVEKHFVPQGASLKTYATQDEVTADLAAGRIDYVLANAMALDAFLASDAGKACCESKGTVETDSTLGGEVGFGVRKEDNGLRDRLNGAIKALAHQGKFDEIATKWQLTGRIVLPSK